MKLHQRELIKLNNLDLKTITENLIDTFLEAGNVAKSLNQKGLRITIKSDKSPVTNGDLAVDKILKEKITKLTPHIPIVSEENTNINSRNDSKDFWLLDPIDGTRDYINQKEEYTLNAIRVEFLTDDRVDCTNIFIQHVESSKKQDYVLK